MWNNIKLSLLLTFFCLPIFGQLPSTGEISIIPEAVRFYKAGEEFILRKDYEKAIKQFKKCLKIQPGLSAAHRNIAVCYSLLNDFESSIIHYEIIMESDTMHSRAMYYELAEAYYKANKYNKALDFFERYDDLQTIDSTQFGFHGEREYAREINYRDKIPGSIRASETAIDSVNFGRITNIENVGSSVNTMDDEYFPFVSNDQQMLFFTRRSRRTKDEDLRYSKANSMGKWKNSSPFKYFNTPVEEGRFTMVRDGRTMFFTACNREGVLGPCDIWEGEFNQGDISNILPVAGDLNSMGWESQVSVSCDGSTLYFASDRPGGFGGTDIWFSTKDEYGLWGIPVNLGPNINTPQNEESPFLTNDGKYLYFSSDGHLGMGGNDIFRSSLDQASGKWDSPINLGQPLNTPANEFGFFLCADGKTGYFASDQPNGSLGINFDIYKFELNQELFSDPITFVEGFVKDSSLEVAIGEAVVNLPELNTKIKTDEEGRFFLCLPADSHLDVSVGIDPYNFYERRFEIPLWENREFFAVDIMLQSDVELIMTEFDQQVPNQLAKRDSLRQEQEIEEEEEKPKVEDRSREPKRKSKQYNFTVLFGFDSSDLSPDDIEEILEFVDLIGEKEITRVEVIGYADDTGPDPYNLKLSHQRAINVANYLIKNHFEVDQVYLEGRGELRNGRPKNLNRKVDIRIYTLE